MPRQLSPTPAFLQAIDLVHVLAENMSQWLERIERHVSLQRIQIASAAVLASVLTTGVIFGSFALRRRIVTEDLKASIPTLGDKHHTENVRHGYAA
jgi:hypothetical protein